MPSLGQKMFGAVSSLGAKKFTVAKSLGAKMLSTGRHAMHDVQRMGTAAGEKGSSMLHEVAAQGQDFIKNHPGGQRRDVRGAMMASSGHSRAGKRAAHAVGKRQVDPSNIQKEINPSQKVKRAKVRGQGK